MKYDRFEVYQNWPCSSSSSDVQTMTMSARSELKRRGMQMSGRGSVMLFLVVTLGTPGVGGGVVYAVKLFWTSFSKSKASIEKMLRSLVNGRWPHRCLERNNRFSLYRFTTFCARSVLAWTFMGALQKPSTVWECLLHYSSRKLLNSFHFAFERGKHTRDRNLSQDSLCWVFLRTVVRFFFRSPSCTQFLLEYSRSIQIH